MSGPASYAIGIPICGNFLHFTAHMKRTGPFAKPYIKVHNLLKVHLLHMGSSSRLPRGCSKYMYMHWNAKNTLLYNERGL